MNCVICGAVMAEHAETCPDCGAPVRMSPEERARRMWIQRERQRRKKKQKHSEASVQLEKPEQKPVETVVETVMEEPQEELAIEQKPEQEPVAEVVPEEPIRIEESAAEDAPEPDETPKMEDVQSESALMIQQLIAEIQAAIKKEEEKDRSAAETGPWKKADDRVEKPVKESKEPEAPKEAVPEEPEAAAEAPEEAVSEEPEAAEEAPKEAVPEEPEAAAEEPEEAVPEEPEAPAEAPEEAVPEEPEAAVEEPEEAVPEEPEAAEEAPEEAAPEEPEPAAERSSMQNTMRINMTEALASMKEQEDDGIPDIRIPETYARARYVPQNSKKWAQTAAADGENDWEGFDPEDDSWQEEEEKGHPVLLAMLCVLLAVLVALAVYATMTSPLF